MPPFNYELVPGERVDERSHPKLDWMDKRQGTWIIAEMVQSDAYRSLSKIESDILLFIMIKRQYPKKNRSYWKPSNRDNLKISEVAIADFFDGSVREMYGKRPAYESIRRAFKRYMEAGFLSLVHQGGNGKGDQNIYRLENNWRLWKKGDPPCFTKEGMTREKGFCKPGSGHFNQ